jgi:hypothetical protein
MNPSGHSVTIMLTKNAFILPWASFQNAKTRPDFGVFGRSPCSVSPPGERPDIIDLFDK